MTRLRLSLVLTAALFTCLPAAGQGTSTPKGVSPTTAKPVPAKPGNIRPGEVQPADAEPKQPTGQPAEVAPSGLQPEARERLEAATKALAEANALSFKITAVPPQFGDQATRLEGVVEMARNNDGGPGWMTRREGTLTPKDLKFLVVGDGQIVSWINHEKKTVFEKYARSAKDTQITAADTSWIKQLADPQPFATELAAPKATLEGTANADGTPCEIVVVDFGENKPKLRWFFAATDHLPRRLERGIGTFQTTYEITDLKVNPELPADRFTLATPEGYKREAVVKPVARPNPADSDSPPSIAPRPRPMPGDADAPPALRTAPAFELQTTDGKAVTLESLKGNIVVLGFWGSWHRGGKMAAPELQALADNYQGKPVKVYWLALKSKDKQSVLDFVAENKLTIGTLTDADAVAKEYQVRSYPGFAVVGLEGEVLHQSGGFVAGETMGEIQKAIDAYLAGDRQKPAEAPGTGNTPGGPGR
jgi:peroxiredoxin